MPKKTSQIDEILHIAAQMFSTQSESVITNILGEQSTERKMRLGDVDAGPIIESVVDMMPED